MRTDQFAMDLTPAAFRYAQADAFTPANAYYGPAGADIVSATGTPTVGDLYAIPFYAGFGGTIDRIAFRVTTAGGAGSKARVGIYDSDTGGYGLVPRNLLFDGGEQDGTQQVLYSTVISPGLVLTEGQTYWLAFISGTSSPTINTLSSGWHPFGRDASFGAQFGWQKVGFGYGPLPASFPSGPPQPGICGSAAPLICVRFATYNRMKRF